MLDYIENAGYMRSVDAEVLHMLNVGFLRFDGLRDADAAAAMDRTWTL